MNYYEILEIPKTATADEIKKSYNRLVLKYHPDRNKNKSESEKKAILEKYLKIKEAYDVLSDPVKKREYDRFGNQKKTFNYYNDPFQAFNFDDFGFDFSNFKNFKFTSFNNSFFDDFFNQKPSKFTVRLPLSDFFKGCLKKIKIVRNRMGRKENKVLEIYVKPGQERGTVYTFRGEGDQVGNRFQDLEVELDEVTDKIFTRKGDDLEMKIKITLKDLIRGFSTPVTLPSGKVYNITHKIIRKIGEWNSIPGLGMPKKYDIRNCGNLNIFFTMDVPPMEEYRREGMSRYL